MTNRRAVLFDIDGVLTVSWQPLPGAASAVERIRDLGWKVAFVTNTTSTPRSQIAERLEGAGFALHPDEIFTAPLATATYLRAHHPGARCLLVNSGAIEVDLEGITTATDEVEVVVTGGAGPDIGYDVLNKAYRALVEGAPLVAMHRNFNWETADGLQLDMGVFIAGLEQATGTEASVVGKPSRAYFEAVLAHLDVEAGEAVMVGDDIEADIGGAQAVGIGGALVRTGKFRPDALRASPVNPDDVIDSVSDLPDLLGSPS
ncbi:MAG TPA: TIGR01458 family HAD-type hydrolase [Acidimicrobiales bacterium]|jgi:HAD superfamily hydrolase (TIGR01458 family)|nr:TIGR01458 family HAD-type hydrolase [Acidimicrobiales bacterium]